MIITKANGSKISNIVSVARLNTKVVAEDAEGVVHEVMPNDRITDGMTVKVGSGLFNGIAGMFGFGRPDVGTSAVGTLISAGECEGIEDIVEEEPKSIFDTSWRDLPVRERTYRVFRNWDEVFETSSSYPLSVDRILDAAEEHLEEDDEELYREDMDDAVIVYIEELKMILTSDDALRDGIMDFARNELGLTNIEYGYFGFDEWNEILSNKSHPYVEDVEYNGWGFIRWGKGC